MLKDAQSSDNPLKMLLTFNKMKKYVVGLTSEMFDACEGSELIIYHPGAAIGYFAGNILGIPSVLASPFPMHKTKEYASIIAYGRYKLPAAMTYSLLHKMLWMAAKTGVSECLKTKYGKLPENFSCPYERIEHRRPVIVSCSNHVFPRPKDWNENIHQYGYWFTEEQDGYRPPLELDHFLSGGEKPVYIGFGSVFHEDEKGDLVNLITDALHTSGRRGIICGMGEIQGLPEHIIAVGSVPHTWLFPRCSAVCHHGGAGTSASGFAAGVPSVIIPFTNDQFAWAHRAYDLGVGSKPIPRKKLTASRLSDAIGFAAQSDVIEKALLLGEKVRNENGSAKAAKVIADLLSVKNHHAGECLNYAF